MNFGQPACSVGSWCRNSVLRSSPTLSGRSDRVTRRRSVNANSFEGTFASPWIGGPTATGGAEKWPSAATLVGNAAAAIAVAGIVASTAPGRVRPGPVTERNRVAPRRHRDPLGDRRLRGLDAGPDLERPVRARRAAHVERRVDREARVERVVSVGIRIEHREPRRRLEAGLRRNRAAGDARERARRDSRARSRSAGPSRPATGRACRRRSCCRAARPRRSA